MQQLPQPTPTAITPDSVQEPPVPVDANPNQLLAYQADQARKQTQGMKAMVAYLQSTRDEQRILLEEVRYLRTEFRAAEKDNGRTRFYIGCAFFIFVALPILTIVMGFLFGSGFLALLLGS